MGCTRPRDIPKHAVKCVRILGYIKHVKKGYTDLELDVGTGM